MSNKIEAKPIQLQRIFTDADLKTHVGRMAFKPEPVTEGEDSLVPPGCTRYFENKAMGVLVRRFPAGFTTGYHNDPTGQHQLIFTIEGTATGGCMDGTSFHLKPGDFASVEDPVGTGHSARDEGGTGFTQLFVSLPAS